MADIDEVIEIPNVEITEDEAKKIDDMVGKQAEEKKEEEKKDSDKKPKKVRNNLGDKKAKQVDDVATKEKMRRTEAMLGGILGNAECSLISLTREKLRKKKPLPPGMYDSQVGYVSIEAIKELVPDIGKASMLIVLLGMLTTLTLAPDEMVEKNIFELIEKQMKETQSQAESEAAKQ